MSFSNDSVNAIWKRSGGPLAKCFTCGRKCADGWNLDASHMDHTKNHDYDDPTRGQLECLWCHLTRHVRYYYEYCLKEDSSKKRLRENRYMCHALVMRILAGEDRHERGPIPRTHKEIKTTRKELVVLIEAEFKKARKAAKKNNFKEKPLIKAEEKILELCYMIR